MMSLMPMSDGLSLMATWTTGAGGGGHGTAMGKGDGKDPDDEESVKAGMIKPEVVDSTEDRDCTGCEVVMHVKPDNVDLPHKLRPPLMSKVSVKVRWERLLTPEVIEKDDEGRIRDADASGGQASGSTPAGSGRWE
jgi:hypothetical protein